ncbi:MAG: bifunctional oligoribonuclease/PAP phosphatase NrnA [Eubacterium sp.]|nr:bifunctional oligoribonuclease/PAP phosphatase NrnA [Eubacterium sp.]
MISAADKIAIIGHVRPDGDCIGSTLGMYNYISENFKGKTVQVYVEAFSSSFRFLSGSRKVKHEPLNERYDLAISLDVASLDRLGDFEDIYKTAISTVCIDHHISNPGFGDLSYIVGGASSACEVLCDLIDMDKVSEKTANCIYLGMVHDTGVFKYSCTSRKTMELAGLLLEKGVKSDFIIDETFYKKTYKQNKLMSRVILESQLQEEGKVIIGVADKGMFREYKCTSLDTEGIVEQLRLTDGVEVAIFAYQLSRKQYKFSLRSKSIVDVSEIAVAHGGGGHVRAAGFDSEDFNGDLKRVLEMVRKALEQA